VTSGPGAPTANRTRPRVQTALEELRSRSERVTPARRAVLEVLDGTADHLTAEEIVAQAERSAPGVHRATVYRALATLGELGLITHTHLGGSAAVYHLSLPASPAPGEPASHAHLQCTRCHAVIDVPVDALTELAVRLEGEVGFELQPEHAALLGLCADCRRSGG
jgi:Fur family transcriptional regulator, ferric uptake regulator